jgi:tetratricopeptide (TPR) repeat protein
MKKTNWLDVTEYLLLAGSGLGSVAAIASQQLAFTAAPMSLLLLVNLINRRRIDQELDTRHQANLALVEKELIQQIENIDRRVQGLPTFWDLASLRKTVLQKNRLAITQLHHEISHRLTQLEEQDVGDLHEKVDTLQSQQTQFQETLGTITSHLSRTASVDRVRDTEAAIASIQNDMTGLNSNLDRLSRSINPNTLKTIQGQIDYLNRRFNSLPNPVDTARLRQDLDGLLKVISDMVSRRELQRLIEEVQQVHSKQVNLDATVTPLHLATRIMRRQVETLITVMRNNQEFIGHLGGDVQISTSSLELQTNIAEIQRRLETMPSEADLVQLRSDFDGLLGSQVASLKQDLKGMEQSTQHLEQQQEMLHNWINRLPELLDFSALRNQMKYLGERIERNDNRVDEINTQLETLVQQHQSQQQYELVFDWSTATQPDSGRNLLTVALEQSQTQVTVVLPRPDYALFDSDLMQQLRHFLDRGGHFNLGWGYLGVINQQPQPRYIHQKASALDLEKGCLKRILTQLNELRQHYPEQFRFKVLGSDDNFLVSDKTYAILGFSLDLRSHAFAKITVGLKTSDSAVIQHLLQRFEHPILNEDDLDAYFNRALTRSELNDVEGAIADYTRVVQINPKQDVAYNNRGILRYQLGNKEGAIADFNRALTTNPVSSITYCNRGIVRSELGNAMGAVEDFSNAIQVDSNCLPAYFQRGLARTQMGNKMGAVEDFSHVIRLNDQEAAAFLYRGMARTKLGDRIGAIRDLKEASRLFGSQGNSVSRNQALNMISQIQRSLVVEGSEHQSNDSHGVVAQSS